MSTLDADIKANDDRLAACDSHLFEFVDESGKAGPWGVPHYRCRNCGGNITVRELHWYMVGRAHGNKFGEDKQALLDAYAQRVTDQDVYIATLLQREEVR